MNRTLAALTILSALAGTSNGQTQLQSDLTAIFTKARFSGSVLAVKGAKPILISGFGDADRASHAKIGQDTAFCIGSISKWFTAVVMLRLEQDGKLKVGDAISKYIPGVPADKAGITIHQLMTHSAGTIDYIDRPGEGGDFAKISKAEAMSRILGAKLLFAPGARSEYSNAGYTLLAAIAEAVGKKPYESLVREMVFARAGMKRTGFYGDKVWPDGDVATGYGRRSIGKRNAPNEWPATTWALKGAGGIVSTPSDMGLAIRALASGKILDAARWAKMEQGYMPLADGPGKEGYGWIAGTTLDGERIFSVAGGNEFGFHACMFYLPDHGDLLIGFCNSGGMGALDQVMIPAIRRLRQ